MKKLIIKNLSEIDSVALEFLSMFPDDKVFAFYADMGVGKTTFIKSLNKVLGVVDDVSSPTFSIVNEYESVKGFLVYHFDFYRIDSPEEALDFGFFEYIDSGNYCFIEWPEMIEGLLPENTVKIKMYEDVDGSRVIEML